MTAFQPSDGRMLATAQAAATIRDMDKSQRQAKTLLEELQSLLGHTTIGGGARTSRERDVAGIHDSPNADEKGQDNPRVLMPHDAAAVRSQPNSVNGLRPLYRRVEAEMRGHERALEEFKAQFPGVLAASDSAYSASSVGLLVDDLTAAERRMRGRIDCSNLPSAEARWDIIKRCHDLKAVGQKFEKRGRQVAKQEGRERRYKHTKEVALVDAVVDGGTTWLRVLGITESRLLHDMAEAGWDWGRGGRGDDAHGSQSAMGSASSKDEDDDDDEDGDMGTISLIQTVQGLIQAARRNSRSHRPRTLHIVLTRVREHSHKEIGRLLGKARKMGTSQADDGTSISIVVDAADSAFCASPAPPLESALRSLAPASDALGRVVSVGPVANLDASTLMALVSDISHACVPERPWHRPDIRKQVRAELSGAGPTVAGFLYPLLAGRALVCTLGAARRVRHIVGTLGSGGEPARLDAMLPVNPGQSGPEEARRELQRHSIHPVPPTLRLPIRVVDAGMAERWEGLVEGGALPRVAGSVARDLLNDVNMESFLYGWETGVTTVTANQTLAQQILKRTESDRAHSPACQAGDGGKQEPRLYVHMVRRSLGAGQQAGRDNR
ncbi:hypothetical protein RB595_010217 [Gaeumannomyces hyphopodioides]